MLAIHSVLDDAKLSLTKVSDSAQLDSEVLLAFALEKNRSFLRAWPDKMLTEVQFERFTALVSERRKGKPIAYITGSREFWSREFEVSPDVLIPRPETELLIELSLQRLEDGQPVEILDLGTGSGIIGITLAIELPSATITATDNNPAALRIAISNAKKLNVKNIGFYLSDWFTNIPLSPKYDLIVSNPPYIDKNDLHLQQGDLLFEPDAALIAGESGLAAIRNIAGNAWLYLKEEGYLLIEHGFNQKQSAQKIFKDCGYVNCHTFSDLAGHPRATLGQIPKLA